MLRVRVIAVGRLKERYWVDACAEYLKRLGRYVRIEVCEVADCDPNASGGPDAARRRETLGIARLLGGGAPGRGFGGSAAVARGGAATSAHGGATAAGATSFTILWDRSGTPVSSEELAELLHRLMVAGKSQLNLIIGGSTGVDAALLPRLDESLSFGRITLPHNLARVVCLEQLYRACRINAKEPYHK
jgi:23S rRNA (pseudouridine1915-N3)-methyltransferase